MRDLTKPKQANNALKQSEEIFRLLVQSVHDYAIFMLDPEGNVVSWNSGAERIKGYRAEEILGRSFSTFYTPEDIARRHPWHELAIASESGRYEEEGWRVRKDGSRFWANVVITAVRDESRKLLGFAKVTRDLTERRGAEAVLLEREEQLSITLQSIGDAVIATNGAGLVTMMNPVAEQLTGWSLPDAAGQPLDEVFRIINEETRAPAPNPVYRVLREGTIIGLANHTALIARDGSERPIADSAAPIRNARGEVMGVVLVFRDMTVERRVEEERIHLAQANEAVRLRDEFLSLASHELRTPLTTIQLELQSLVKRKEALDAKTAHKIERATHSVERLVALVESLLDVSRVAAGRMELEPERFDLSELIADVTERFSEQAKSAGCAITLHLPGAVVGTWDRLRVEQVITNLMSNALKYGAGNPVRIELEADGLEARIRVIDAGPGIPEQEQERIFHRFERAAPMKHHAGLGLGLYIARQIAGAHGGSLRVSSRPGEGATFTCTLPLARDRRAETP